jgi:anti-sigma-K factor RskA
LNLRNKPELQERLAAEYALGTLRGAARTRFRRWLREDAALARTVSEWQERLTPMVETVAPVRPHPRVWGEVAARLGPAPVATKAKRSSFWQALGLVASGAAAALVAVVLIGWPPSPAPQAAGYVAVLSNPKTQRPVLFVSASRNDAKLKVRTLDPAIQMADASLQLWALPRGGRPQSLGVIPPGSAAGESTAFLPLPAVADRALGDVPMLAVSLEPKGGSPSGLPTGPVLYSGPCVKDW